MPSITQRGMEMLNRTLPAAGGVTVRYVRGASVCEGLVAVPGAGFGARASEGEQELSAVEIDWTFARDDLWLNGLVVTPLVGDVIEWDDGQATRVFEVLPQDSGQPWRNVGPFDSRLRVHTKQIDRRLRA